MSERMGVWARYFNVIVRRREEIGERENFSSGERACFPPCEDVGKESPFGRVGVTEESRVTLEMKPCFRSREEMARFWFVNGTETCRRRAIDPFRRLVQNACGRGILSACRLRMVRVGDFSQSFDDADGGG